MTKRTWLIFRLIAVKKFVKLRPKLPLTTVRNYKDYSQIASSEQNVKVPIAIGSDASKADSSNEAWQIKIFLN